MCNNHTNEGTTKVDDGYLNNRNKNKLSLMLSTLWNYSFLFRINVTTIITNVTEFNTKKRTIHT